VDTGSSMKMRPNKKLARVSLKCVAVRREMYDRSKSEIVFVFVLR